MSDTYPARPTADDLNAHLKSGGSVTVATYARATLYKSKHAGWFSESPTGDLRVVHGNRKIHLSMGAMLLVSLRLSR